MTDLETYLLTRVAELEAEVATHRQRKEKNRIRMRTVRAQCKHKTRTVQAQVGELGESNECAVVVSAALAYKDACVRAGARGLQVQVQEQVLTSTRDIQEQVLVCPAAEKPPQAVEIISEVGCETEPQQSAAQSTEAPTETPPEQSPVTDQPKKARRGGAAKNPKQGTRGTEAWRQPGGLPWMGDIRAVFQAAYGVQPEARGWGKALVGAVKRLGIEAVCAELTAYCHMTALPYLNCYKFADMCGGWRRSVGQWEEGRLPPRERQQRASKRAMDEYFAGLSGSAST